MFTTNCVDYMLLSRKNCKIRMYIWSETKKLSLQVAYKGKGIKERRQKVGVSGDFCVYLLYNFKF